MQHVGQRQQDHNQHLVEVLSDDGVWTQHGASAPNAHASLLHVFMGRGLRHWRTRALAVVISLALHALLVGSALLGTAGRLPIKPLNEGAPTTSHNSDAAEFVTTLLLLKDHSITPPDQAADDFAYAVTNAAEKSASDELVLTTLSPSKPPQLSGSENGTDENASIADAAGDEAGKAMLFGRYMGQIKARIERAWDYPNSNTVKQFDCKVQVKQSPEGKVEEVTLQRCDGDPDWQVSLVQAIQLASPLSAPPDDSVFSEFITLSFSADQQVDKNTEIIATSLLQH